ncbi:MAG: hypothetical protein JJT94_02375 [Bernardetiaceae bacterium]|nr:hypothetical protein [Bernardetiaceae bacterium]
MKLPFQYGFILCLLGLSFSLKAQELNSFTATARGGAATTFATDYHAIGVNPANLGVRKTFRDPIFTVGVLETNLNIFSAELTRQEIFTNLLRPNQVQFDLPTKREAAERFTNSPLAINLNATLFGAYLYADKIGGFAFSVRDQINFFTRLNRQASELAFLGHNASYFDQLFLNTGEIINNTPGLSDEVRETVIAGFKNPGTEQSYAELLDGSRLSLNWTREFNLAYGNKIIDTYDLALHLGGGIKYINGIALIDLEARDGALRRSNISMSSSFGLDFGEDSASVTNPTFQGFENQGAFWQLTAPKPVGQGLGFDLGFNLMIRQKLFIGASVVNIGKMRWAGNVYNLSNGILAEIQGAGYDNFNLARNSAETLQFAGSQSPFQWEGSSEIAIQLPTMARFGVSYDFFRTLHFGIDVIVPLNDAPGNLDANLYIAGLDLMLTPTIRLSSGLNLGGNQAQNFNIPLGIAYIAPKKFYEMGIATQDIKSYTANFNTGSNVSLAFGFLRFRY